MAARVRSVDRPRTNGARYLLFRAQYLTFLRALKRMAVNRLGGAGEGLSPAFALIAEGTPDPVTLEYLPGRRGDVVFQIPIDQTRAFRVVALRLRPDCHPFVRAAQIARVEQDSEKAKAMIQRVLRR